MAKTRAPKNGGSESIQRAWLLLSIKGKRQYAGNTGYADVPGQIYRYDSYVPNAKHVAAGDLVILRDREGAYGFAAVEQVRAEEGTKEIQRRPACKVAQIKERTTKSPCYLCKNLHEFDMPLQEIRECIKYEAHFGDTFVRGEAAIPTHLVRGAVAKFNGHLSIQPVSLSILAPFMEQWAPRALEALKVSVPALAPMDALKVAAGPKYSLPVQDSRQRVLREICARRGQKQFRDQLLGRYGRRCMISGCELMDVPEAAHIHPQRSVEDNYPDNGLILHCDLHTLFDLDLPGVEPETLAIHLHPAANCPAYASLCGATLQCNGTQPSEEAQRFRWALFQARLRRLALQPEAQP